MTGMNNTLFHVIRRNRDGSCPMKFPNSEYIPEKLVIFQAAYMLLECSVLPICEDEDSSLSGRNC